MKEEPPRLGLRSDATTTTTSTIDVGITWPAAGGGIATSWSWAWQKGVSLFWHTHLPRYLCACVNASQETRHGSTHTEAASDAPTWATPWLGWARSGLHKLQFMAICMSETRWDEPSPGPAATCPAQLQTLRSVCAWSSRWGVAREEASDASFS